MKLTGNSFLITASSLMLSNSWGFLGILPLSHGHFALASPKSERPLPSQNTGAEAQIAAGDQARLAGNYPLALRQINLGLKALENDKAAPDRLAAAYNYLALLNNNMGQYADSEKNARKALSLANRAGLSKNILARHQVVLANALRQQGKFSEAQNILKDVIATIKNSKSDKALFATATNNLGALYFWMGYYHQAIGILNQGLALRLALAAGDKQNLDLANSYLDLGCTEFKLNQLAKAKEHLTVALSILKKKLGDDHPETLNAMANLAALLAASRAEGDSQKALDLLRHTVEAGSKKLDSHHPDLIHYQQEYAETLTNQASWLTMNGQQQQAFDTIQQAIKLRETIFKALGRKDISYALALANAAEILRRLEKPSQCLKMLTQANDVLDGLTAAEQQSVDGKSIRQALKRYKANH